MHPIKELALSIRKPLYANGALQFLCQKDIAAKHTLGVHAV